jgi:hypothetical protein
VTDEIDMAYAKALDHYIVVEHRGEVIKRVFLSKEPINSDFAKFENMVENSAGLAGRVLRHVMGEECGNFDLDFSSKTEFHRAVYKVVSSIPRGGDADLCRGRVPGRQARRC